VLLVLVDLASPDGRSPDEQERVLMEELRRHEPALAERPRLVVGSKADLSSASSWTGRRVSALTGEGLRPLLGELAEMVAAARSKAPRQGSFVVHRPASEGAVVERADNGDFVVRGRSAERAVALSDLTNTEALAHAQQRLRRLGVHRALARAGARRGDLVRIGGLAFEYEPDQ
jgi:GTP-binding protein